MQHEKSRRGAHARRVHHVRHVGGRHRAPRPPRPPRKRTAVLSSVALAGAAGVGLPIAAFGSAKTVTLSVDGVAQKIATTGNTVGEVLESQNVEVGRHDAVAPAPEREVEDGQRIAVRHGRQLSLTVDGTEQDYWVTALRVGPALGEIGRRFSGAELSASRSARIARGGMHLTVKTPKAITLVEGGDRSREVTRAVTVGEALTDLGVAYDSDDVLRPGPEARIDDGSLVRLVHMDTRTRRVEVTIPSRTIVRYDADKPEGSTEVLREGSDGLRVDTYRVVLADGRQRSRTKTGETVTVRPVNRIEVHGTGQSASSAAASSGGGISSAACPGGSSVEQGLGDNAVAVHRAVCARFPQVDTYYGLRPGDSGEHGQGRALDIMVYSDSALGDAIAEWVKANYRRLGVSEVIWAQRIWTVQRSSEGWRGMEDRGSTTANHYDHVHVTVY